MKLREIKVYIESKKDFLKKVDRELEEIERGKRKTLKENSISFQSIEQLKEFLTPKRIELLKVIKHKKPGSIYELAKMVKRKTENVNSDIKLLKHMGFVETKKVKDVRKKVKPEVNFNKLTIEIPI